MGVHVLQPVLGGLLVVATVYLPIGDDLEVVLELEKEIVRGNLAAGEEVAAHPVRGVAGDEVVAEAVMRENVREEHPTGLQPARDVGEEALVIFEVLKHLDGDDAVELRGGGVEDVDVGRDDREVGETTLLRLGVDVLFLGAGVGDRGDLRAGELFGVVEGEGAPAAAEFEDGLAVGELGALGVEGEHGVFGLVEGFFAGGIEAAGVFQVFAEAELVETGGDFVVLLVGGGGLLGEWTGLEIGDIGLAVVDGGFVADALGEEPPDADAEEPVGEKVFLEEGIDHEAKAES